MSRVTKGDLEKLVDAGYSVTEISEKTGLAKSSVSERCKVLGLNPVRKSKKKGELVVFEGVEGLGPMVRLRKIARVTDQALKKAISEFQLKAKNGGDIGKAINLLLKVVQEVRNQFQTELLAYEKVHHMAMAQSFKEFSEEVLSVIGEVDEDVKKRIVERLRERKASRSVLGTA